MQIRENIFGLIGDMTGVRPPLLVPTVETPQTDEQLAAYLFVAGINDLAFSPDSLYMATAADEGLVIIWSIKEVSLSHPSM
jgi:hypothetical protein